MLICQRQLSNDYFLRDSLKTLPGSRDILLTPLTNAQMLCLLPSAEDKQDKQACMAVMFLQINFCPTPRKANNQNKSKYHGASHQMLLIDFNTKSGKFLKRTAIIQTTLNNFEIISTNHCAITPSLEHLMSRTVKGSTVCYCHSTFGARRVTSRSMLTSL